MYQNYRELPPLPKSRSPELQIHNRFEDQSNPVKLVQSSTEKWIEQARDYGNKTEAMTKEFSQHMDEVRRRTQEEFSMGSQNRSRSQNYTGGQKKMLEHRRKHLHVYSNKRFNNGMYTNRYAYPPTQGADPQYMKPTSDRPAKPYADQEENAEEDGPKEIVKQRKITKTIRYVNDDNEEIEQRDEMDFRIVGKTNRNDLPKMSEALRLQQGEYTSRDSDRPQIKATKKQGNQSIFKRLHDKAQNVYAGLNGESNVNTRADDDSRQYQQNFQSAARNGQAMMRYSGNSEQNSNTLSRKRNQSANPPQYYQPQGQRIIDEKLEEIRRRNRDIQAEIEKRTQNLQTDPHFNLDEDRQNSQEFNFNASPIKGPDPMKGIAIQPQSNVGGGKVEDSGDFLEMFKGKGGNQLAQVIQNSTTAAAGARSPISQAPLKPASGILVTQGATTPATQKGSGQQNFQSEPPPVLQRIQSQGKQFGQMIEREASQKPQQTPQVMMRFQGPEFNQMIERQTKQNEKVPEALQRMQGKGLSDLMKRQSQQQQGAEILQILQSQQQLPEILQKLKGNGPEFSAMMNREGQQQSPEIMNLLQGHGRQLADLINKATQQQQPPEILRQLQGTQMSNMISRQAQNQANQVPEFLRDVQGKPIAGVINKEGPKKYSSDIPPMVIQQIQGKPLSQMITQQTAKYQSQIPQMPQMLQQLKGQPLANFISQQTSRNSAQMPQIMQQIQGKPISDLIIHQTLKGQEKMPQMIQTRFKGGQQGQQAVNKEMFNKNNVGGLGAQSAEEFQDSQQDSPQIYSNKAEQYKHKQQQKQSQAPRRILDQKIIEMVQNPHFSTFNGQGKQSQNNIGRGGQENQARRSYEEAGSIIDGFNSPSIIQNMGPSEMGKFPHSQFKPIPGQAPRPPVMIGQPLPAKGPGQFASVQPGVSQPMMPGQLMPGQPGQPRANALMGGPNMMAPGSVQSQSMSPIRGSGTQMPQPIYYSPPPDIRGSRQGPSNIEVKPQFPNDQASQFRKSGIQGSSYMMIPHNPPAIGNIPGTPGVSPSGAFTVKTITATGPAVQVSTTAGLGGSRAGGVVPPAMPNSAIGQSSIPSGQSSMPPSQIPKPPSQIPAPPPLKPSNIPGPFPGQSAPPSTVPQGNIQSQTYIHPSNLSPYPSNMPPGQQLSAQMLSNYQGANQTMRTSQMGPMRTSQMGPPIVVQEVIATERQLLPGMGSFMQTPQLTGSRMIVQTSGIPQTVIVTPTQMPPPPTKKKHWYSKCCTIF